VSIFVDETTRVCVQGITGRDGSFHTGRMLAYGTRVVAGKTPGKGGETVHGVPVFNSVGEAVEETGANASVIFVPARAAAEAAIEAAEAGVDLIVCSREGVPTLDAARVCRRLSDLGVRMIGPNCPGIISPGKCKVGIMPGHIHLPGSVGVISRSGTLGYEIVKTLSDAGFGQSTCVGIGGDPIIGSTFLDLLPLFEEDAETDAIVLIGEIGGQDEVKAAAYWQRCMKKKVLGFMAGLSAPAGSRMGHAGAIVDGEDDTATAKIAQMKAAGIPVARLIGDVVNLLRSSRIRG